MGRYRDDGIVLRTHKLGESDRIVVLLTAAHGKVRAVAKGVRKPGSRFGGRLEPPSHAALLIHEGRSLDVVSQADTIDHFRSLREDLERLGPAMALLEVVDQVAREGEPDPALYRMLLGALRTLAERPSPVLVPAFYWKLLAAEGVRPELDCCVRCGGEGPLVAFDVGEGGVLCRSCRSGRPLSPAALVLLRRILGGDLNGALAEGPGAAAHDVAELANRAMEHHLERRLRAVAMFDHR